MNNVDYARAWRSIVNDIRNYLVNRYQEDLIGQMWVMYTDTIFQRARAAIEGEVEQPGRLEEIERLRQQFDREVDEAVCREFERLGFGYLAGAGLGGTTDFSGGLPKDKRDDQQSGDNDLASCLNVDQRKAWAYPSEKYVPIDKWSWEVGESYNVTLNGTRL